MKLTKQLILLILSGIMLITVTALLIFMLRSDATAGESTPSSTAGITSTTMPSTAVAASPETTVPPPERQPHLQPLLRTRFRPQRYRRRPQFRPLPRRPLRRHRRRFSPLRRRRPHRHRQRIPMNTSARCTPGDIWRRWTGPPRATVRETMWTAEIVRSMPCS